MIGAVLRIGWASKPRPKCHCVRARVCVHRVRELFFCFWFSFLSDFYVGFLYICCDAGTLLCSRLFMLFKCVDVNLIHNWIRWIERMTWINMTREYFELEWTNEDVRDAILPNNNGQEHSSGVTHRVRAMLFGVFSIFIAASHLKYAVLCSSRCLRDRSI